MIKVRIAGSRIQCGSRQHHLESQTGRGFSSIYVGRMRRDGKINSLIDWPAPLSAGFCAEGQESKNSEDDAYTRCARCPAVCLWFKHRRSQFPHVDPVSQPCLCLALSNYGCPLALAACCGEPTRLSSCSSLMRGVRAPMPGDGAHRFHISCILGGRLVPVCLLPHRRAIRIAHTMGS